MSNFEKDNTLSKVERLVTPIIKEMGLDLVDIEYMQDGGYWYLRIFIEKPEGEVSLADCATLSNMIDEDVDKIIDQKFFLEVSSPGIERPLKKIEDFIRFSGESIFVALKHKIEDSKNYTGYLVEVKENDIILLEIDEDKILEIPFKEIKKAHLVYEFEDLD